MFMHDRKKKKLKPLFLAKKTTDNINHNQVYQTPTPDYNLLIITKALLWLKGISQSQFKQPAFLWKRGIHVINEMKGQNHLEDYFNNEMNYNLIYN